MHGRQPAEWRFLRGWTDAELSHRLERLASLDRNVAELHETPTPGRGWRRFTYDVFLDREPAEVKELGPFQRARDAVADYAFTDSRIVRAHFDPASPLLGRRMLLEIRVLGLRWLCGVVVGAVRSEAGPQRDVFGYRYDTLAGHIERGSESFCVTRTRSTGEIRFRIDAAMRPGDLPGRWARVGFLLLTPIYQRLWHRRAQRRLRMLTRGQATTAEAEPPAKRRPAGRSSDSALLPAAMLGAVSGLRCMSAPALLGRSLAASGTRTERRAERFMASRSASRVLTALAAAELLVDKLPFTPPRTRPLPLAARVLAGAVCGAAVAARLRRPAPAAALVGAAAAVAAAFAGFRLRRAAVRRFGLPDAAVAVVEDLAAMGIGAAATKID